MEKYSLFEIEGTPLYEIQRYLGNFANPADTERLLRWKVLDGLSRINRLYPEDNIIVNSDSFNKIYLLSDDYILSELSRLNFDHSGEFTRLDAILFIVANMGDISTQNSAWYLLGKYSDLGAINLIIQWASENRVNFERISQMAIGMRSGRKLEYFLETLYNVGYDLYPDVEVQALPDFAVRAIIANSDIETLINSYMTNKQYRRLLDSKDVLDELIMEFLPNNVQQIRTFPELVRIYDQNNVTSRCLRSSHPVITCLRFAIKNKDYEMFAGGLKLAGLKDIVDIAFPISQSGDERMLEFLLQEYLIKTEARYEKEKEEIYEYRSIGGSFGDGDIEKIILENREPSISILILRRILNTAILSDNIGLLKLLYKIMERNKDLLSEKDYNKALELAKTHQRNRLIFMLLPGRHPKTRYV